MYIITLQINKNKQNIMFIVSLLILSKKTFNTSGKKSFKNSKKSVNFTHTLNCSQETLLNPLKDLHLKS